MNVNARNTLKNLGYAVFANLSVLFASIVLNLIVPRFIGISQYSYWQLYVFYIGYVGFFHLGWLDGIYLKIGGEEYRNLDKQLVGSQFWYLLIFQLLIAILMSIGVIISIKDPYRLIILLFTMIVLVIMNAKTFILYILQATNRIKEYAQLSRNDVFIYLILLSVYLFNGGENFIVLISFDVVSKLIVTIWGMYLVRDIIFVKILRFKVIGKEIVNNLAIGSNLMLSNISSFLVMGVTRFFVERNWNIETFGKLSLTLSISNMFMTFINAVGIVMFPMLRRTEIKRIPDLYVNFRNIFVPLTFILLVFYSPVRIVLNNWLPDYTESLFYMGILFPMVVFEGRTTLLVNTFLKTLRKEKKILVTNVITLLFSIIMSWIAVFLLDNLNMAVISIMVSLILRCLLSELFLSKILQVNLTKNNLIELIMTGVFILGNIFVASPFNFVIYFVCLIGYLFLNFKSIKLSLKVLISLMR